jgi:hypothetical protein
MKEDPLQELQADYDSLLKAFHAAEATNRQLRERILKLEEIEGLYKTVVAQNVRLVERIREMKHESI